MWYYSSNYKKINMFYQSFIQMYWNLFNNRETETILKTRDSHSSNSNNNQKNNKFKAKIQMTLISRINSIQKILLTKTNKNYNLKGYLIILFIQKVFQEQINQYDNTPLYFQVIYFLLRVKTQN